MSFANPLDLNTLTATQGFRLDGAASNNFAARSAASAGDVNGDGFADLIVGVPFAAVSGRGTSGAAYVVFGKASGFANMDFASLGTQGFRLSGAAASDTAGNSVASAGDVNGDGFADIIIGAAQADNNGRNASGSAYVVFGKASGFGNVDLASLGTQGFRIDGAAANDQAGNSVASAGDVNGDGYADIILGANLADSNGRTDSGSAYVVFGKASGFANVDLANLGTQGFRIDGQAAGDLGGWSVASAGDINGDGFADIIIGARSADNNGRSNSGSTYVVFGKASGFGNIDLASLGTRGFRIDGQVAGDQAGWSAASAGDVNGDGFGDLILGARLAGNNGRAASGSAYVVFGKASGFANIDLDAGLGSQGFRIDGAAGADQAGLSVGSAGDVNGDGFGDLIVGAPQAGNNGRSASGSTYVIFGKASGFGNIDLASLGTQGVRIDGAAANNEAGYSAVSGGDVDGDGFADLVIGASSADHNGRTDSGSAYVLFSQGTGNVALRGTALADSLAGGEGNDTLWGFGQNDRLFGRTGDDTLNGGAGNDAMDGGTGADTASYAGATSGVTVSLATATAQATGGAGTDTLTGLENLLGSAFADSLTGDGGTNIIDGGAGNDVLNGGVGNDALGGGVGTDTVAISGSRSAYTVTKNAGAGWTLTGADGTDATTSVERLQFADQVVLSGFARTEDMAGRSFGDILFQNVSGGWLYRWQMEGAGRDAEGAIGGPGENWVVAGKGDFNADLNADILWRNTVSGDLYVWLMSGTAKLGEGSVGTLAAGRSVGGVGDTDGDGRADIVLRGTDGSWAVQRMDGTSIVATAGGTLDAAWGVAAVADFNGDLKADVLWRNSATGQLFLWQMDGSTASAQNSYATPGVDVVVAGTGDLDGDGRADVVMRHATQNWFWGYLTDPANAAAAGSGGWLGTEGNGYVLAKIADYTGDDRADLLFYDAAQGFAFLQSMNGLGVLAQQGAGAAGAGFAIL